MSSYQFLFREDDDKMFLDIDPKSRIPIWQQIVTKLRELVIKSVLIPGEKIPSVDEMAKILAVNKKLVAMAYSELESLGVIESVRDVGTFISSKVSPDNDEKRILVIKLELSKLVTEAKQYGLNEEEIKAWIKEVFESSNNINRS
jgi:GntR family transcriptional regulator